MIDIKRDRIDNVLVFILATITSVCLPYTLPLSDITMIKSSLIWLILIVPIYFWYKGSLKKVGRRNFKYCVYPAVLLSMCLKLGRDLSIYGELSYNFFSIMKNLVIVFGVAVLIYSVLINLIKYKTLKTDKNILNRQYSFLFLFCIFLIAWIPMLLIFWPGIFTYDAAMQISQIMNNSITEHHPMIHTLLLSFIVLVGKLTGNYYLGAAIHTMFQMLVCICVNAYICSRLSTFRINKFLYYLILFYYLFFPLNLLTPIYITKDTLFSTFFLLLIFKLCEYYTLEKKELSKKRAIELIIIIILVGLFRNNAIYALLATIPFLLLIKKRKIRKNLIFVFMIGSFFTMVTNQALIIITNAKPGMEGQMYSVPLQQLARSYIHNPDSFTKQEKKDFFAYVPEANVKNYNPRISDYVKGRFTLQKKQNSTVGFIKLWMKIGLKNKKNYINAFLMLTQGYWDPNFQFPDNYYKIPIIELKSRDTEIYGNFDEKSWFPKTREKIINNFYYEHSYKKLSIVSLLFAPGFIVWMFILLFLYSIYKGFKDSYFILVFLTMYYGTLILGPVALVRYIYPYMLIFPVMLVFVLNENKTQNKV